MNILRYLVVLSFLFIAGCAQNPADDKPTAAVATPAASPVARVEGVEYKLAEGSKVEFTGSKVTGSHDGGFEKVEGMVVVPEGGLEQSQITITMDMTTTYSDSEKLTGHLKSDEFFDVEKFPTSTFESTMIKKGAEENAYEVTGNLSFHGVTKAITFPATIEMGEGGITARAEFTIDRNDFEVRYPGKPDDLIRPEVVIKFEVMAKS